MRLPSVSTLRRRVSRNVGAEGIAVSCRVRLARNLRDAKFPDWADELERRRVFGLVTPWLERNAGIPGARTVPVGDLDETTRALLCERHLISRDLSERGPGSGLVVSSDETVAVMINEEDHFRIQVIEPGMDLHRAWTLADALDARIESRFPYAFASRLGYLTACPSNVGTGLRASVMVHLIGLRLTNELDAVLRALERMALAVRGLGGEGSDAVGHMFQISNQETLGADEVRLIDDLLEVVGDLVHQERNARLRLNRDSPEVLQDCVARALAILQCAKVMETEEALGYLSALRLGVEMGMVRRLDVPEIESLARVIQSGHLQKRAERRMEAPERDRVRAGFLQECMKQVELR